IAVVGIERMLRETDRAAAMGQAVGSAILTIDVNNPETFDYVQAVNKAIAHACTELVDLASTATALASDAAGSGNAATPPLLAAAIERLKTTVDRAAEQVKQIPAIERQTVDHTTSLPNIEDVKRRLGDLRASLADFIDGDSSAGLAQIIGDKGARQAVAQ